MMRLDNETLIDCVLTLQAAKESIRRGNDVFVCSAVETGAAMWSPEKMDEVEFDYWNKVIGYLQFWIRDMLGDHFTLESWSRENNLSTAPEPLRIAREWWLNWMIEELREEIVSA